MTIGFGIAVCNERAGRCVGIAADSRLSSNGSTLSDAGVKTYALGGRSAMVAAGSALPAISAADIVRPFIEDHNRTNKVPIGFYDTVRLVAFFLKRSCSAPGWSCQVVVVGFLQSGRPCLASVTVSQDKNRVTFFSVDDGQHHVLAVGEPNARSFLLQGLAAAHSEGRKIVESGLSIVRYMSKHPGAFNSIGGGLSLGSCDVGHSNFSWPHVQIDGRRYVRGVDVTDCARPSWPPAVSMHYDETWCADLDLRLHRDRILVTEPEGLTVTSYEIETMSTPETLFQTCDDAVAFDAGAG